MPEYHFTNRVTGEPLELFLGMKELRELRQEDGSIIRDGVVFDRNKASEMGGGLSSNPKYPIQSDAAGVHPDQIPEMSEHMRKSGVNLNFTSDGRAIFENAAHRRSALRALGMHDRDGYD